LLKQIAGLVSQGVPYETVLAMSPARRMAWLIALGEARGGNFNWQRMEWERPKNA
jgi:hypothetical protein